MLWSKWEVVDALKTSNLKHLNAIQPFYSSCCRLRMSCELTVVSMLTLGELAVLLRNQNYSQRRHRHCLNCAFPHCDGFSCYWIISPIVNFYWKRCPTPFSTRRLLSLTFAFEVTMLLVTYQALQASSLEYKVS